MTVVSRVKCVVLFLICLTLVATAVQNTRAQETGRPGAGTADYEQWRAELEQWERDTYSRAREEGRLVWYSVDPRPTQEALIALFQQRYPGISVEVLDGRGGALTARIRTEQDAGQPVADIFIVATSATRSLAWEDRVEDFVPPYALEPGVNWFLHPLADAEEFGGRALGFLVFLHPVGLIVNSELVPEGQEPACWRDLLDPRWKDWIISHDPRIGGFGNRVFFHAREMYGEDYWRDLVDQGLTVETEYNLISMALATGEYSVGLAMTPRELMIVEGAPLRFYTACEGVPLSVTAAVLLKGAPHPNAGKLFLNLLLSPEAQNILGSSGTGTPLRPGTDLLIPEQSVEGKRLIMLGVDEELNGLPRARDDVKRYLGD